jgi:hypothetical protein
MLKNVRLSFNDLFEARGFEGGTPKFSATVLIPKGSATYDELIAHVRNVAKAQWADKAAAILKTCEANLQRWPLKDGDTAADAEGNPRQGWEGQYALKGSNAVQPLVIGRDRLPLTAQSGKPYSGCYVNIKLDVWAQDNRYGKAINVKLLGIQFWDDGERFGSADSIAKADDFETAETDVPWE